MDKNVCFSYLIQGTFEGLYKLSGKLSDESYSVAEKEWYILYHYFSDSCVQGGEKFVLSKDVRFGQEVHKRALPYIGIPYKGKSHHRASIAPLRRHLAVNFFQFLLKAGDSLLYNSAVDFDLGFAHTSAGSDASPLSLKMGPHTGEPREHILVPGELYLHFCV